jgi:MGT family glycosyltransferase
MSHILVCAVPNPGHVGPMLSVATHLKEIGYDVTFNTSQYFRDQVESAGIHFASMIGKANYDYRQVRDSGENGKFVDPRLHFAHTYFANTIPDQYEAIKRIQSHTPIDLILVDTFFFGAYPMLLGPRSECPPFIGCGVNPMFLSSHDCGYSLPPTNTLAGQHDIEEEKKRMQTAFRSVHDQIDSFMKSYGVSPMPYFFVDCMYLLPDIFLQFTAEAFEFPRSDMPDNIRFVGPMLPKNSVEFKEPAWWNELDGSRPVVLVTQGTLANHDLNEVFQPALTGLADEDVLVIVAAGRTDTETLRVPENARIASFIPFDRLLPKVDVMVTNGGYGAVNHAFSLGIPIVVAGETEDKDRVAARIGWTGAGINLKTRYAEPEPIRSAVGSILSNKQYRNEAERLQKSFARYNTLDRLAHYVAEILAQKFPEVALPPLLHGQAASGSPSR